MSENAENREFLRFLHSLIAPALERIWYVAASLSENWKEQEMTGISSLFVNYFNHFLFCCDVSLDLYMVILYQNYFKQGNKSTNKQTNK